MFRQRTLCSTGRLNVTQGPQQAAMTATAAAAADQLSLELLASILELVEPQERLSSCDLVCEAWAVAATAGTRRISFSSFEEEGRAAGFHAWLRQHSSNLSSLEVAGLPPASFYSSISSLTQLQDLSMEADGDSAPFHSLPALSSLTRLSIENGGQPVHHAQLPQGSLNLPKLKVLELEGVLFNPCILDSMTQLQEPEINLFITDTADLLVDAMGTASHVERRCCQA